MKKMEADALTIIVDDAGSGDLLFGVVIGAYREETDQFTYDVINVSFYQEVFAEKKISRWSVSNSIEVDKKIKN